MERYHLEVDKAKSRREEGTTLYGLVLQQKYINVLSNMINDDIKLMTSGTAGNHQTALKVICQCLPSKAFDNGVFLDNSPSVSPNVRVGPDAHVCRLFPGLVAWDESNGNDKFGLGDDYMYPDGKSEWTAVYEAVDEAYAFTGAVYDPYLPSVPVREINE